MQKLHKMLSMFFISTKHFKKRENSFKQILPFVNVSLVH